MNWGRKLENSETSSFSDSKLLASSILFFLKKGWGGGRGSWILQRNFLGDRRLSVLQFLPNNLYMNMSISKDCFCLAIQINFFSLIASEASQDAKTGILNLTLHSELLWWFSLFMKYFQIHRQEFRYRLVIVTVMYEIP